MPHDTASTRLRSPSRPAAVALAASTVLSIAIVAVHPTIQGGPPGQILHDLAAAQALDQHVHGALIMLMMSYLFGFAGLAGRLDLRRPAVLAGLIAYAIGTVAMIGAALIDGFIAPAFAARFLKASPDEAAVALDVLLFGEIAIQYLSKLGFIGLSAGMLGCSLPLLRGRGLARATGLIGLVSGVLPAGLLIVARIDLEPTSLIMILAAEAVWNLAAAALLLHGADFRDEVPTAVPHAA